MLDASALRAPLEEKVRGLRQWFGDSRNLGRKALRELLGERRLAVHSDDAHGFRIEGFLDLVPELRTPQHRMGAGAFASVIGGSGGPI